MCDINTAKIFGYKHCFCHLNVQNVKANSSLVGIIITIGDITDIFATVNSYYQFVLKYALLVHTTQVNSAFRAFRS